MTNQEVFGIQCPICGKESIVLPRQNLLGKYEGRSYLSTGKWPITLLCRNYVQVSFPLEDSVQLIPPEQVRTLNLRSGCVWRIVCECAHGSCGRTHYIYATPSVRGLEDQLISIALRPTVRVQCEGGHALLLVRERMRVESFDF
jgi:hypothetical protein